MNSLARGGRALVFTAGRQQLFTRPSAGYVRALHARPSGTALSHGSGKYGILGAWSRLGAAAAPRRFVGTGMGSSSGKGAGKGGEGAADPFEDMPDELKRMAGNFKPDLEGYREYIKQKQAEGSPLHMALEEPKEWYKRAAQSPELGFVVLMSIIASLAWNLVRRKKDLVEWEHERNMREAALMEHIAVLEQSLAAIQGQQPSATAAATPAAAAPAAKAGGRIVL
mmetsp:Transcript_17369/g.67512  ORF Transcript_17369/g.67512 Transcript_17369/m.67512 type:complete len:225 (-) Transcript_17369:97-771(-)